MWHFMVTKKRSDHNIRCYHSCSVSVDCILHQVVFVWGLSVCALNTFEGAIAVMLMASWVIQAVVKTEHIRVITKTRPCNIQRFFTDVKMTTFS